MAVTEVIWCGDGDNKLYRNSGYFTSTIRDSQAAGTSPRGCEWDGTNTVWLDSGADKLMLQSGKFDATVKNSLGIGSVDTVGQGISSVENLTSTPWSGNQANKFYDQSGQFNSTIKTSEATPNSTPRDNSWDGTNTFSVGAAGTEKLFIVSDKFTTTIKDSYSTGAEDTRGISFDGTDTPWCGERTNLVGTLYKLSGALGATIKDSLDVSGVDSRPSGMSIDDVNARLGVGGGGGGFVGHGKLFGRARNKLIQAAA